MLQPAESTVRQALADLLSRREGQQPVAITADTNIYEDLEMDSLEVAELSALLEDELGSDPYSQSLVPQTVGELLGFYA